MENQYFPLKRDLHSSLFRHKSQLAVLESNQGELKVKNNSSSIYRYGHFFGANGEKQKEREKGQ